MIEFAYGRFTKEESTCVRINRILKLMRFEIKPEDKKFLELVANVVYGKASDAEKTSLEALLRDRPDLKDEFRSMRRGVQTEGLQHFWDLALRQIFGTASAAEVKELEAFASKTPRVR